MPRNYKRKQYKRRMPFTKSQMKAIQKISQRSGELKHVDSSSTHTSVVTGGGQNLYLSTATLPAQGDGENQRVGDQINIKSVRFKAQVNCGTANGSVRCYVVQHLDDTVATINNLDPNDFFPTLQTSLTKYKVLYNKVIQLDPDGKSNHIFMVDIPAKRLKIKRLNFDSAASTLTGGGDISFHVTSNNATASQMTSDLNTRFSYYD